MVCSVFRKYDESSANGERLVNKDEKRDFFARRRLVEAVVELRTVFLNMLRQYS